MTKQEKSSKKVEANDASFFWKKTKALLAPVAFGLQLIEEKNYMRKKMEITLQHNKVNSKILASVRMFVRTRKYVNYSSNRS